MASNGSRPHLIAVERSPMVLSVAQVTDLRRRAAALPEVDADIAEATARLMRLQRYRSAIAHEIELTGQAFGRLLGIPDGVPFDIDYSTGELRIALAVEAPVQDAPEPEDPTA